MGKKMEGVGKDGLEVSRKGEGRTGDAEGAFHGDRVYETDEGAMRLSEVGGDSGL